MKSAQPQPELKRPNIKTHHNPVMHALGRSMRFASKILLSAFDDGRFYEDEFELTQIKLAFHNLPPEFEGYRLLQLSDIHLGNWMNPDRLSGVVALALRQQADLICITGDFITHVMPEIEEQLTNGLSRLSAPDGVYAVFGNHDYWSDQKLVERVLDASQIRLLRNQVVRISRERASIVLAGLDDVYNSRDDLPRLSNSIQPNDTCILLVHVPDYADVAAASGYFDLQLSGHSHGGQIRIPGLGTPFLPPLGRKYVSGLNQLNGMYQYTNRGVGTATLPVRWNCPPEITIFQLTQSNA
jgi:predicted MPP superfamily phosphohydrolase